MGISLVGVFTRYLIFKGKKIKVGPTRTRLCYSFRYRCFFAQCPNQCYREIHASCSPRQHHLPTGCIWRIPYTVLYSRLLGSQHTALFRRKPMSEEYEKGHSVQTLPTGTSTSLDWRPPSDHLAHTFHETECLLFCFVCYCTRTLSCCLCWNRCLQTVCAVD